MNNQNRSVLKEAARLLGASHAQADFAKELQSAYSLLQKISNPRSIYKICPVSQTENGIRLSGTEDVEIQSNDLKQLFAHSSRAVVLAVTLGAEVDAAIRKQMACDMHRATLLDACASAEVERVCDNLEQQLFAQLSQGEFLTRRFSPGYGDLDIKYSSVLVNAFHTQKEIGLSITQAGMLVPAKSVTAMLGISNRKEARHRQCSECAANADCIYKKRGERCGI